MKPYIHAQISAKKFGGAPEDYFEIHDFMDCSKGAFPTNAHRTLTHNAWFIKEVLERVKFTNSCDPIGNSFPNIKNSEGKLISVRDIGEQHILDDFGNRFIPSAQDYLENLHFQDWMGNAPKGYPSSYKNTKQESTRGILNTPKPPISEESIVFDGNFDGVAEGDKHINVGWQEREAFYVDGSGPLINPPISIAPSHRKTLGATLVD